MKRFVRVAGLLALTVALGACQAGGPTATPSPTPAAPESGAPGSYRPECFVEDPWVSCQDPQLGLSLRYPSAWGFLTGASLTPGSCGGQSLAYSFDPWTSGPQTGGASRDFCQPGAGPLERFSGFPAGSSPETSLLERCRLAFPEAAFCQEVSPQIWLVGLFPDAQAVCQAGSGPAPQPRLAIAIDLPDGRPIGGLVLAQVFLSPDARAELYAPLGGPNSQPGPVSPLRSTGRLPGEPDRIGSGCGEWPGG